MSPATPVRIVITRSSGGAFLKLVLGCSCAKVSRSIEAWDDVEQAIAELRRAHRRFAPECPHVWVTDVEWRG